MSNVTKILVATRNQGKLKEYQELLAGLPIELATLDDVGIEYEVDETGQTFEENAVLKAQTYAQSSGLCTLADDSGLEVDALHGEPGVRSARYAGPGATDSDKVRYLLHRLESVPSEQRSARFRCVIAIATAKGSIRTCQGMCEGLITTEPHGQHGFGYDPVFYVPELNKTMAEVSPTTKNRISHRARATVAARRIIEQLLDTGECHEPSPSS